MSNTRRSSKDDDISSTSSRLKDLRISPTKKYSTGHREKSVALIFDQRELFEKPSRQTTYVTPIAGAFRQYGFDVRIKTNFTVGQLQEELQSVANENHENRNCLVVVVLSYGVDGNLLARDAAYPIGRLWEPFLDNQCQSLVGKPKLFFIEACNERRILQENGSELIDPLTVPQTGDIFVFHGVHQPEFLNTTKGNGAVFIQSLRDVLQESESIELFRLRLAVLKKVIEKYESNCSTDWRSALRCLPNVVSNLTGYFTLMRN